MKNLLINTAALSLCLTPIAANAEFITFDDYSLTTEHVKIINEYEGFDWENTYIINGDKYEHPNTGYTNGIVSGEYVGFGLSDSTVSLSRDGETFNIQSIFFAGAWRNDLDIHVTGWLNGSIKDSYDQTVIGQTTEPHEYKFNYEGIDELKIYASGGTPAGLYADAPIFVFEHIVYSIPEPSTLLLLAIGTTRHPET